jgi:pyruvate kinase
MSQVLESMITKNSADRKELQDISTACLEGADCFALCHETSVGVDPVAAMT